MVSSDSVSAFIDAIQAMKKVRLRFYSKEDGSILERTCAPMDYGPSRRAKQQNDRFHLWDYDSDTEMHTLSLNPDQVVDIAVLDEQFDPQGFITWDTKTSPWFVTRDWGTFS